MRPRTFADRLTKYSTKYAGANVTTVLTAIKPSMDTRYENSVTVTRQAVETARGILNDLGIPTAYWATYISFVQAIAKLTFSFSGLTLQKEVSALKAQWVYEKNADPAVLDRLIQAILGITVPY